MDNMAVPLLSVQGLQTKFFGGGREFTAVNRISFDLHRGEFLAIVGESGSGKSVTALSILQLLPQPQGRITDGKILFDGIDLARLPNRDLQRIRGNRIAMIFQEPMTSLNPVLTVGDQIMETLILKMGMSRRAARARAIELLRRVKISLPERRIDDYPHQLSGGMRQRVMIAMALSCDPDILIADEPTTALDVTIQAQILDLLQDLQREYRMAMILITHDLGIVRDCADRALVMYGGHIVEEGRVAAILSEPSHPYTKMLVDIVRVLERDTRRPAARLSPAQDGRPDPSGCVFFARCTDRTETCQAENPPPVAIARDHTVACFNRRTATGVGALGVGKQHA